MITDTEAIVLRQVKTVGGRRMLLLFSKKFGKISVGSNISEGGKNKSALALRPFTYGRYELFKSRDTYNLNHGQVIKSYYSMGENLDKYMAGSYVLELTEKLLADELQQQGMFRLLLDFLDAMEKRSRKQETLVIAYMVKALVLMGVMPETDNCSLCGKSGMHRFFSVEEGGVVCPECGRALLENKDRPKDKEPLIYEANFDIVNILKFLRKEPFSAFEKLALEDDILKLLYRILKDYLAYHLDVKKLKSEDYLNMNELEF